jgi:hypothetical protein
MGNRSISTFQPFLSQGCDQNVFDEVFRWCGIRSKDHFPNFMNGLFLKLTI